MHSYRCQFLVALGFISCLFDAGLITLLPHGQLVVTGGQWLVWAPNTGNTVRTEWIGIFFIFQPRNASSSCAPNACRPQRLVLENPCGEKGTSQAFAVPSCTIGLFKDRSSVCATQTQTLPASGRPRWRHCSAEVQSLGLLLALLPTCPPIQANPTTAPPWCEDEGLLSSLFGLQHRPFTSQQGTDDAKRYVDIWSRFLERLVRALLLHTHCVTPDVQHAHCLQLQVQKSLICVPTTTLFASTAALPLTQCRCAHGLRPACRGTTGRAMRMPTRARRRPTH